MLFAKTSSMKIEQILVIIEDTEVFSVDILIIMYSNQLTVSEKWIALYNRI